MSELSTHAEALVFIIYLQIYDEDWVTLKGFLSEDWVTEKGQYYQLIDLTKLIMHCCMIEAS